MQYFRRKARRKYVDNGGNGAVEEDTDDKLYFADGKENGLDFADVKGHFADVNDGSDHHESEVQFVV